MTTDPEKKLDDHDLYKVAVKYTWKDFGGTFYTLGTIVIMILFTMVI